MSKKYIKYCFSIIVLICVFNTSLALAADVVNINVPEITPRAEISISPARATFIEGSIFEVPILLNTKGKSMNSIDLHIKYDKNKLHIVNPSVGQSVIGMWVDAPKYDNTTGTANFIGSIPGGVVSNSSVIVTITFQAKSTGTTEVTVSDTSRVLANDGIGTQAILSSNRGVYTIMPKPPGEIIVYSDTHPFQDHWYNNNNPTLAWEREPGVIGFSYVLDDKPNTIPDNQNLINETSKAYQDLNDGLWYFHIKALRNGGAWGVTNHYLLRIDTKPPAKFNPKVNYTVNNDIDTALVTFFTTDTLSGVDHFEIGVINKDDLETSAPLFVRSESPYNVPASAMNNSTIIVRAYDMAGNSLDVQISMKERTQFMKWFSEYSLSLLIGLLILLFVLYLIHYLWGHRVLRKLSLISHLLRGKKEESVEEAVKELEQKLAQKGKEVTIQPEPEPSAHSYASKPKLDLEVKPEVKPEVNIEAKAEPLPEVKPESPKAEPEISMPIEPEPEFNPEPNIEILKEETSTDSPEVVDDIEVPIPPSSVTPQATQPQAVLRAEPMSGAPSDSQANLLKDKMSKPMVNVEVSVEQEHHT